MLQLKRTIGGFMISTDGNQGADPTARPTAHPTTNDDEAKSLDFITKNLKELTGLSNIEEYKKAEERWSKTRSVKAGPIPTSLSINTQIRKVDKDGNCLLHSVIQGLGLSISHQKLRKEVVEKIDTKLSSFKQELLEYFNDLHERSPFFTTYKKEDLLEALRLNIADSNPDKEKIQHATQHYLKVIQKVGISLGGSVIETLQRLYRVNFDIRDRNFDKIETFYNPLFNQTLTLRLSDGHYDIIVSN
jgi:hypothetical protein